MRALLDDYADWLDPPVDDARGVVSLLHARGSSAALDDVDDVSVLAPKVEVSDADGTYKDQNVTNAQLASCMPLLLLLW